MDKAGQYKVDKAGQDKEHKLDKEDKVDKMERVREDKTDKVVKVEQVGEDKMYKGEIMEVGELSVYLISICGEWW